MVGRGGSIDWLGLPRFVAFPRFHGQCYAAEAAAWNLAIACSGVR
jgi:hypothetical protein